MKKIVGFISISIYFFSATAIAFAQTPINLQPPTGSINNVAIQNIPQFIITLLFVIGIIVAISFLIYGGIKWVMSGGDKAAVESARNHIVAAIVGLVIVAGAFFILNVVFALLGVNFNISNLCIPTLSNGTVCK